MVEHHYLAVELCRKMYRGLPEPKDGWLTCRRRGLDFEPDYVIREIAKLPLSRQRQGDGRRQPRPYWAGATTTAQSRVNSGRKP
jgi:hypothetical protein